MLPNLLRHIFPLLGLPTEEQQSSPKTDSRTKETGLVHQMRKGNKSESKPLRRMQSETQGSNEKIRPKKEGVKMSELDSAILVAVKAHNCQKDKGGQPYILHALRVMMKVEGLEAKAVAVMHDAVEDSDNPTAKMKEVREVGFSETIMEALDLLTHKPEISYTDYIIRIKPNKIATEVKLADLEDNSRLDRAILPPHNLKHGGVKLAKYLYSYRFLKGQIKAKEYRRLMDSHKNESRPITESMSSDEVKAFKRYVNNIKENMDEEYSGGKGK